jgi:hypothetical protein
MRIYECVPVCACAWVCGYAHLVPALYEDPTSLWADNCTYIEDSYTQQIISKVFCGWYKVIKTTGFVHFIQIQFSIIRERGDGESTTFRVLICSHLQVTRRLALKSCPWASTEHHTIKTYWGVEVKLHAFLTSALDGGEWSASQPGRFTPGEYSSRFPLDRMWGGLQNRSGHGGAEKNSKPQPGIELRGVIAPLPQYAIGAQLKSHWQFYFYRIFTLHEYDIFWSPLPIISLTKTPNHGVNF